MANITSEHMQTIEEQFSRKGICIKHITMEFKEVSRKELEDRVVGMLNLSPKCTFVTSDNVTISIIENNHIQFKVNPKGGDEIFWVAYMVRVDMIEICYC